jgi:hypothetical protein
VRDILAALILTGSVCVVPVAAQWLDHPTPGIPRLPDGRPNLSAPLPRTADGRPDLSGLWVATIPPYVVNKTSGLTPGRESGLEPGTVPFKPWAEALFRKRLESDGIDDPSAHCVTGGVPRVSIIPYPFRIVTAPGRVVILYEIYQVWREIFTDGRDLPKDPNPTWMGYSIGRWDGNTFVVRSSGFNGKAWVDPEGRPTTDALQVTERFRRKDFGHMELEVTIDDAKAYDDPWTVVVPLTYYADTELLEYVCNENNKSRGPQP